MPCRYDPTPAEIAAEQKKAAAKRAQEKAALDLATRVACTAMKLIESLCTIDYTRGAILHNHFIEDGLPSEFDEEMRAWWQDHKNRDEQRRLKEEKAAKKKAKQLKQQKEKDQQKRRKLYEELKLEFENSE